MPAPVIRKVARTTGRGLVAAALFGAGGCELVDELLDRGGRTEALRAAALEELADTADRFLGRIGDGPVLRTEVVSDSLVRVVVPDDGAPGGEAAWELEWTHLEVYPVFPGADFADHVQERATARDRRRGLTREGWTLIAEGRIVAVGRVEAEARAVGGRGRVPVERAAYLEPVDGREEPRWTLQPDTRTVLYLRRALRTTYEELMYGDERVMDCAGTAEPTSTPRPVLLDCASEVMAEDYGDDPS